VKIDEKAVMVKRCIDEQGIRFCDAFGFQCHFFTHSFGGYCNYLDAEVSSYKNSISYVAHKDCPLWKDDNGNS